MTRINVVPVQELSDLHLIAEYRELPRVIKQDISVKNAPQNYKLGEGHVKWARTHLRYVINRYIDLYYEMKIRGFKTSYNPTELVDLYNRIDLELHNDYKVTKADIAVNRQRLLEKYRAEPNLYKWTKRRKPFYYYSGKLKMMIGFVVGFTLGVLLWLILMM